ncbi:MAG: hypothetical protein AAFU73_19800 [Planctomycetota bacterium]
MLITLGTAPSVSALPEGELVVPGCRHSDSGEGSGAAAAGRGTSVFRVMPDESGRLILSAVDTSRSDIGIDQLYLDAGAGGFAVRSQTQDQSVDLLALDTGLYVDGTAVLTPPESGGPLLLQDVHLSQDAPAFLFLEGDSLVIAQVRSRAPESGARTTVLAIDSLRNEARDASTESQGAARISSCFVGSSEEPAEWRVAVAEQRSPTSSSAILVTVVDSDGERSRRLRLPLAVATPRDQGAGCGMHASFAAFARGDETMFAFGFPGWSEERGAVLLYVVDGHGEVSSTRRLNWDLRNNPPNSTTATRFGASIGLVSRAKPDWPLLVTCAPRTQFESGVMCFDTGTGELVQRRKPLPDALSGGVRWRRAGPSCLPASSGAQTVFLLDERGAPRALVGVSAPDARLSRHL